MDEGKTKDFLNELKLAERIGISYQKLRIDRHKNRGIPYKRGQVCL